MKWIVQSNLISILENASNIEMEKIMCQVSKYVEDLYEV